MDSIAVTPSSLANPHIKRGLERIIKYTEDFKYERKPGDKMPRANAWRPYRFAVQDVIFAATVIRHAKESNCIEVDVFLTAEPFYDPEKFPDVTADRLFPYEPLSAAKALTLMLLSEAFRCGTDMMLKFTKEVEGGPIPMAVLQLALRHKIFIPDIESGILRPPEARRLYAALTGFQEKLDYPMQKLQNQGLLSIERACYLVHHGVWSAPELEGLILGCPYPDLVLDGEVQPESRHLYHHAQIHTRTALLGGVLDRALLARDHPYNEAPAEGMKRPKGRADSSDVRTDSQKPGKDVEDDERDVLIEFEEGLSARLYRLGPREVDNLPLPDWCPFADRGGHSDWKDGVSRQGKLIALLRPRDQAGMVQYLESDIEAARDCVKGEHDCVAVVVPLDFNDLPADHQTDFLKQAHGAKVVLLVCPETARTLDGYAREKLNRSRVLPE